MVLGGVTARAPAPQMALEVQPVPWLPSGFKVARPSYLDGTLAGDIGFDPLGFAVNGLPNGLPVSFSSKPTEWKLRSNLMWMREAEVKHGRLAMLAAAGWPLAELWHGAASRVTGLPYGLDSTQGRSLSLLNGHLFDAAPFLALATLGMVAIELQTLDQVYGLTATGKTMSSDGRGLVMKSYVPGDCGFDPLGLYDVLGSQVPAMTQMEMEADPEVRLEWIAYHRKEMETAEIKHGRAAMLAITGFAVQEFVTGVPVVDQTPLFFTPFWDVLAPGAVRSLGILPEF